MKTGLKIFTRLILNAFIGLIAAFALGVAPALGAVVGAAVPLFAGSFIPNGCLPVGVLTEVWTGEVVKALNEGITATWLDGIPDYSAHAENDVIHLVDVEGEPDVLINNSTYPIPIQEIGSKDIAISLDKFQTKATRITDDELYATSFDKMKTVKERHKNAILRSKFKKAIHALAPQRNTLKTPVVLTTGVNEKGRRRITDDDIIEMKSRFDAAEVPETGRRLVLCADHVNDLLKRNKTFKEQYHDYKTGKIMDMYGFAVYTYVSNPYFTPEGVKIAFGKEGEVESKYQASVAFWAEGMFKASGTTKMYYSESEKSPQTQESLINFRHRFIVLPKKQEAIGAIVSATYKAEISATPDAIAFPVTGGSREVAISATSDFGVSPAPEGFVVTRNENVLFVSAIDNTGGAAERSGVLTLTLSEDPTKQATVTLTQPNA